MEKEIVKIDGVAENPGSSNHVVKSGGFRFFTNQLSADPKTGQIIPGDVTEQTIRAMDNLKYLVESCGSQMDNIVKVVVYMRDTSSKDKIDAVCNRYFQPGQEPAKVCVRAPSSIEGVDVEIDAIAR